jgi:RHS repeat-associated protein
LLRRRVSGKALPVVALTAAGLGLTPGQSQAEMLYVLTDHLGTPQVITNGQNQTVWKATVHPFGEVESPVALVDNPIRFPGQYFDSETGLHYNYFRDYDPGVGRYLQSDPIGLAGGWNVYVYVYNSPVQWVDPKGLDIWIEGPSGNEPSFHQSVNVGDPSGSYNSYSFGMNGDWFNGEVYQDTDLGGSIEGYKTTTPAQDAAFNNKMLAMLGQTGVYGWDDICRSWSQSQFNGAPGTPSSPPPRIPVPQNPGVASPSTSQTTTGGVTSASGSSNSSTSR